MLNRTRHSHPPPISGALVVTFFPAMKEVADFPYVLPPPRLDACFGRVFESDGGALPSRSSAAAPHFRVCTAGPSSSKRELPSKTILSESLAR